MQDGQVTKSLNVLLFFSKMSFLAMENEVLFIATFHIGLHCLPKYLLNGFHVQNENSSCNLGHFLNPRNQPRYLSTYFQV